MFDDAIDGREVQDVSEVFGAQIEGLVQAWGKPKLGDHIFLGHSLDEAVGDDFLTARGMLSRITGLPVEVGGLVSGPEAQNEIIRLIREAALCVIDISNMTYVNLPSKINFALNSSIEAGIALGGDRTLYLTCHGPRRSPPFMFRNRQVWFYDNGLELVGALRQIAAKHRRMVL